jgi:hypothetical protein
MHREWLILLIFALSFGGGIGLELLQRGRRCGRRAPRHHVEIRRLEDRVRQLEAVVAAPEYELRQQFRRL